MKIFVMVGTHEQQFNRLIQYVDEKLTQHDVFIQTGYSTYTPNNSTYVKMLGNSEIKEQIEKADIVITHGGPASMLDVLSLGKVPIVVPRQKKFGEHKNDHQVDFATMMEKKEKIILILNINDLESVISRYHSIVENLKCDFVSNTERFTEQFEKEIIKLFERKKKK